MQMKEVTDWSVKRALLGRYTINEVVHTLQKNVDGLDIEPLLENLKKWIQFCRISVFKPTIIAPPIKPSESLFLYFSDGEVTEFWNSLEVYWSDLNRWLEDSSDLKYITWRFPEPNANDIVRAKSLEEIERDLERYGNNKTALASAYGLRAKGNLDAILKKKQEEREDLEFRKRNKK
jgi:hypothetical protein